MRSKKRIKPFMKWLTKEWEKSPDLRFGQFLINKGLVQDEIKTWCTEISEYPLPHEIMREIQTWSAYIEKGFGNRKEVFIKDLKTDHIKAILKTQKYIKKTIIEKILKTELKFREKNENK